MTRVQSVWLNVRISIPPSSASYMQGTDDRSPEPLPPDLASALLPTGGMLEDDGGIEPD